MNVDVISISQRRGGVQWPRGDQNGHILRAGMCVVRCQLDFMIARNANQFGQDGGDMAAGSMPNRPADINVDVIIQISAFCRGKEDSNGVGSIKMDIYFMPGCVWLVASSIL